MEQELAYLNSLGNVERGSVERCEREGIWRGLSGEVIESVAGRCVEEGRVGMREGWAVRCLYHLLDLAFDGGHGRSWTVRYHAHDSMFASI